MKKGLVSALVLLFLGTTAALFAEKAPKSVDAIPLYKGFVLDPAKSGTVKGTGALDLGGTYRTYACRTVDLTDVLDWYCTEVMGMPLGSGMSPGPDRETVIHGGTASTVSRVRLSVRGPGLDGAEKSKDWEGAQKNLEWLKAQWKEKRKMVNGDYIANALFEWTVVEPNGEYADIELRLSDESFNWHDMRFAQLVELRVGTKAKPSSAGLPAKVPAGIPTEKDLGLPYYPGALYNTKSSRVIQAMMSCIWTSNDSPQKVIAFYEKVTGLKSTSAGGKYVIQIMPSAGNPSLTLVMVGPNTGTAMGGGATLLVINKQKM